MNDYRDIEHQLNNLEMYHIQSIARYFRQIGLIHREQLDPKIEQKLIRKYGDGVIDKIFNIIFDNF